MRWQVIVVLILGPFCWPAEWCCFVSAHWDEIGPGARFALVLANGQRLPPQRKLGAPALFAAFLRPFMPWEPSPPERHRAGRANLQHSGALAGGYTDVGPGRAGRVDLLHDEAQQTLTLLLFPAWVLSEFLACSQRPYRRKRLCWPLPDRLGGSLSHGSFSAPPQDCPGDSFCSRGCYSVGCCPLLRGWSSWASQTYLPLEHAPGAGLILLFCRCCWRSSSSGMSVIPVLAAIAFPLAAAWCQRIWTESYKSYGGGTTPMCAWNQPDRACSGCGICGFRCLVGFARLAGAGQPGHCGVRRRSWMVLLQQQPTTSWAERWVILGDSFLAGGWALERLGAIVAGMKRRISPTRWSYEILQNFHRSAPDSTGTGLLHRGQICHQRATCREPGHGPLLQIIHGDARRYH